MKRLPVLLIVFAIFVQAIPAKKTRIFTIGDSTMADKDTSGNNPERGWCQMLPYLIDSSRAKVVNMAKNGRSSKSFIGEGLWDKTIHDLSKGDFLFIQFGHNDSKPDSLRNTDPHTSYKANLIRFITEARDKGGIPILFTSIARRMFDDQGNPVNTLGDYPAVTLEVGKALHVPVIDLNRSTTRLLSDLGVEGSKALYMHLEPGISKKEPYGRVDNTHLTPYGALRVAQLAVNEIRFQKLPLTAFLKQNGVVNTNFRGTINREDLVKRHNVKISRIDTLGSLTVGNGDFAFTVDATGLQTFPEYYRNGIPLGTQSQWGWHTFPNNRNYQFEETLKGYAFHGRNELYAVQAGSTARAREAADYFRVNAHRLHLGTLGLSIVKKDGSEVAPSDIRKIDQKLDLWTGEIRSHFSLEGFPVEVITYCHPDQDLISSKISSPLIGMGRLKIKLRFAYPSGDFGDSGCDWSQSDKHQSKIISRKDRTVTIEHELDNTRYFAQLNWSEGGRFVEKQKHQFELGSKGNSIEFSCLFSQKEVFGDLPGFDRTAKNSAGKWNYYWSRGGAIDFSGSTDPRASELERRAILSQYLMAIQCAGSVPPQETGLTYNSWYGKFHLEMHWWHAAHYALWNRIDLLEKSMGWYFNALPVAQKIALRQGYKGARWMKMTDTTGLEAPSGVGSFLLWQQPHIIYFSELLYRNSHNKATLEKYKHLVFETAEFMASFVTYDPSQNRYNLTGFIPAQESFNPEITYNAPYELAYWHWGLSTAQKWRERLGMERNKQWDDILEKISVLAQKDGIYLSAESAPDSYTNLPYHSDHPAVLGALGFLPESRLVDPKIMNRTYDFIQGHWNWNKTWGWDFPLIAMTATRLGRPDKAIDALFMNVETNTYLPNGHNYQTKRLRLYLPGNGGVLSALAMMCAGYDGSSLPNPGIPKDGTWKVKWEGLVKMP